MEGSKKFISYDDAVSLSLSLVDFERSVHSPRHSDFHLERMRLFGNLLGNPQKEVPSVHIAGTKGKGSTAAMVNSILMASGFTVGLATSPHLHSLTERIRVDMQPISMPFGVNLWSALSDLSKSLYSALDVNIL